MKTILGIAVLVFAIALASSTTPLASAKQPGPAGDQATVAQLGAINTQLGGIQDKLNEVLRNPGPNGDQATVAQLDATESHLDAVSKHLGDIAVKLENSPGPVQDPVAISELNMIISNANGIMDTVQKAQDQNQSSPVSSALAGLVICVARVLDLANGMLGGVTSAPP